MRLRFVGRQITTHYISPPKVGGARGGLINRFFGGSEHI